MLTWIITSFERCAVRLHLPSATSRCVRFTMSSGSVIPSIRTLASAALNVHPDSARTGTPSAASGNFTAAGLVLQADACMEILDMDEDGRVSQGDWLNSLLESTQSLPLATFHQVVLAITCASLHQINSDAEPAHVHPINNSQYIMTSLGEQLQEGIAAVLGQMQDRHTVLASKQLWASDGYLPEQFVPTRPIRMLGEWLRDNCSAGAVPEHKDSDVADWSVEIPWASLTLDGKIQVVFQHLEEDNRGCATYGWATL